MQNPDSFSTTHKALLERIHAVLDNEVGLPRRVALLDFPSYSNVGDGLIWLGMLAYLKSRQARVVYVCDRRTYSKRTLSRRLKDGVILLSGGGNFGDLWPSHQAFRLRVMKDFSGTPIVQLPQSIHFDQQTRARETADAIRDHRHFTLLARDNNSLSFAKSAFSCPTFLCPDMAFALGALPRLGKPDHEIVWLGRTDKEAAARDGDRFLLQATASLKLLRQDWLDEPQRLLSFADTVLSKTMNSYPNRLGALDRLVSPVWSHLAQARLRRGSRLLSRGRVVISDRLHGHILAILLGIPHVLLDNKNGKVGNFYQTWTSRCGEVEMVESPAKAFDRAQLLARLPTA